MILMDHFVKVQYDMKNGKESGRNNPCEPEINVIDEFEDNNDNNSC